MYGPIRKKIKEWIRREHLQMFFDGETVPEHIRDLSGSGDIAGSLPPEGVQPMEDMINRYIRILEERKEQI